MGKPAQAAPPPLPPMVNVPQAPTKFDPTQTASTQLGFGQQAAEATRALNLQAPQFNYSTPFGALATSPSGVATQTFSVPEQQLYNERLARSMAANPLVQTGFTNISGAVNKPFDLTNATVEGRIIDLGQRRLTPEFDRRRAELESRLANQGVMPGSEAYREAIATEDRARNDALNQLLLTGRGQAAGEATTAYTTPIQAQAQLLSSLSPFLASPTLPTAPATLGPTTIAAPDYASLVSGPYGQELAATTALEAARAGQGTQIYNTQAQIAQNAANAQNQWTGGLFGALGSIGGTLLGGPAGGALGGWGGRPLSGAFGR